MPIPGAGAFGAGLGSAGFDPVQNPGQSPTSVAPSALFFNPAIRDFVMDAQGRYVTVHPIDQEVVFALWLRFGSIGSAPESGSKLKDLKRQGGPTFIEQVRDICRQALGDMIARNDITVDDITVTIPTRGRTLIQVSYFNNELSSPEMRAKQNASVIF